MTLVETINAARPTRRRVWLGLGATLAAAAAWQPGPSLETTKFVLGALISILPLVIPGIVLAAWMTASGAGDRVAVVFRGRPAQSVVAATVVGALTPVCGITVLPLMAGLLAAGVPLAPVMGFWLASPITGPAMLAATAATLGWDFALGKAAAAVGLGLLGGAVTGLVAQRDWVRAPLRANRMTAGLGCSCGDASAGFDPAVWRDPGRRARFRREVLAIARLMLVVLIPAFAAEFLLNAWLQPGAVSAYVGRESALAVPLAVLVGGPAYIDGYAALPLTRALMDHGMSPGAAMAFLVSGGVVSIWGAMAIAPVLRLKPFLLYLALAATGSMLAGWVFGALV